LIISRSPLRVSFVGGGSDLPDYYRRNGGAVISTAINKYVYVTVNKKFDDSIRIAYSQTEEVSTADKVEHRLVRAVLNRLQLSGGVEITTVADIPARGTGLGSSSAFTVALINGLRTFLGKHSTNSYLAEECCHVEISICGEPIGKQDQYAVAYGGLNLIEFHEDDTVAVSPLVSSRETFKRLQERMLLLYTGMTRKASSVLEGQSENIRDQESVRGALRRMVELTYQLRDELQKGNVDALGAILHENWNLKRSLAKGISSDEIDNWYAAGCRAGAAGGKLLGAGGGGFLLFDAPPERHEAIQHALPQLRRVGIALERSGSQIIFYGPTE